MQRAKAFFFVCAGMFLLALAYHLGATSATAQLAGTQVAAAEPGVVYAQNGEAFARPGSGLGPTTWTRIGNVFASPTPAQQPTWGELKARYRSSAPPAPQGK